LLFVADELRVEELLGDRSPVHHGIVETPPSFIELRGMPQRVNTGRGRVRKQKPLHQRTIRVARALPFQETFSDQGVTEDPYPPSIGFESGAQLIGTEGAVDQKLEQPESIRG
jgi:hypothetical protein